MKRKDFVVFIVFCIYRFSLGALAIVACIYGQWLVAAVILGLAWASSIHIKGE